MRNIFDTIFFSDPNVGWVLIGMVFMCSGAAVVGVFMYLQKRALIGDTVSHAILPGICLAFMFTQTKDPLFLLIGATLSGLLGLFSVNYLARHTHIKPDAALAIVLSVFYGLGILLLTFIQKSGSAAQSGLDKFLFGKAAALVQEDVIVFGISSLVLITTVIMWYRPLKIITFDRDFAVTSGIRVKWLEGMLYFLTVLAIAIGIQAIGVVLMAALLIAPAVAARYWTHKLNWILILAVIFAAISGMIGAYISYLIPKMPTGPWVVVILALFAFLSLLLGTAKGTILRWIRYIVYRRKMLKENILKCLYQLGEKDGKYDAYRDFDEIRQRRYIPDTDLQRGGRMLASQGFIDQKKQEMKLTPAGLTEGERIVRIHRLWELYLTTHLNLPADHVHDNAEAIEHVITPEIEQALEASLAFPTRDPHASPIPYSVKTTPNKQ